MAVVILAILPLAWLATDSADAAVSSATTTAPASLGQSAPPSTADTQAEQETVADALARRVEARRGAASRWAEAFRELGAVGRAVYEVVARTPTAELDGPVRRLSDAANRSRLWLGIAAVIALLGGSGGVGRRWRAWSRSG